MDKSYVKEPYQDQLSMALKRHNTAPPVELVVGDEFGNPRPLEGTVTFTMVVDTRLPENVINTDPFTIGFRDPKWVAIVKVGSKVRILYEASDEYLKVTGVNYQNGDVTFSRGADGTTPAGFYPQGSIVRLMKVLDSVGSIEGGSTLVYGWNAIDTDRGGVFRAEFDIEHDGKKTTYPKDGYITIYIFDDLTDS